MFEFIAFFVMLGIGLWLVWNVIIPLGFAIILFVFSGLASLFSSKS